jgi:hypothetical protein
VVDPGERKMTQAAAPPTISYGNKQHQGSYAAKSHYCDDTQRKEDSKRKLIERVRASESPSNLSTQPIHIITCTVGLQHTTVPTPPS